jgi:hypothetical protein
MVLGLDAKRLRKQRNNIILYGYVNFCTADAQSPVHVLSQAHVNFPGCGLIHCHGLQYGVGT